MFRRSLMASVLVLALSAGRAEAISVRDVIELSKAGLSEPVLLALIEVDRSIFAIDTASLKQLKAAGVSDTVIVAMIRSGRPAAPSPRRGKRPARAGLAGCGSENGSRPSSSRAHAAAGCPRSWW